MSVTLSTLPGKFKCSLLNGLFGFCPDGITPNSGLTGPNNTIYFLLKKKKKRLCGFYLH